MLLEQKELVTSSGRNDHSHKSGQNWCSALLEKSENRLLRVTSIRQVHIFVTKEPATFKLALVTWFSPVPYSTGHYGTLAWARICPSHCFWVLTQATQVSRAPYFARCRPHFGQAWLWWCFWAWGGVGPEGSVSGAGKLQPPSPRERHRWKRVHFGQLHFERSKWALKMLRLVKHCLDDQFHMQGPPQQLSVHCRAQLTPLKLPIPNTAAAQNSSSVFQWHQRYNCPKR